MAIIPVAYHVGIVVADLEESMAFLSDALGMRWCQRLSGTVRQETRDGRRETDVSFCYSLDGPPYLELLEQVPGTVWAKTGLHHLGVWADDRAAESTRLDGLSCTRESANIDEAGRVVGGVYHSTPDGIRLEIIDAAESAPKLTRYLAGGDYA